MKIRLKKYLISLGISFFLVTVAGGTENQFLSYDEEADVSFPVW